MQKKQSGVRSEVSQACGSIYINILSWVFVGFTLKCCLGVPMIINATTYPFDFVLFNRSSRSCFSLTERSSGFTWTTVWLSPRKMVKLKSWPIGAWSIMRCASSALVTCWPSISDTKSYFLSPPVSAGDFLNTWFKDRDRLLMCLQNVTGTRMTFSPQTYLFDHYTIHLWQLYSILRLQSIMITCQRRIHRRHLYTEISVGYMSSFVQII